MCYSLWKSHTWDIALPVSIHLAPPLQLDELEFRPTVFPDQQKKLNFLSFPMFILSVRMQMVIQGLSSGCNLFQNSP